MVEAWEVREQSRSLTPVVVTPALGGWFSQKGRSQGWSVEREWPVCVALAWPVEPGV